MSTFLAVVLVVVTGALLTYGSVRATASVREGRTFLRWMVAVFVAYLVLITLPVVIAF